MSLFSPYFWSNWKKVISNTSCLSLGSYPCLYQQSHKEMCFLLTRKVLNIVIFIIPLEQFILLSQVDGNFISQISCTPNETSTGQRNEDAGHGWPFRLLGTRPQMPWTWNSPCRREERTSLTSRRWTILLRRDPEGMYTLKIFIQNQTSQMMR